VKENEESLGNLLGIFHFEIFYYLPIWPPILGHILGNMVLGMLDTDPITYFGTEIGLPTCGLYPLGGRVPSSSYQSCLVLSFLKEPLELVLKL
jgi:hypothetical protein